MGLEWVDNLNAQKYVYRLSSQGLQILMIVDFKIEDFKVVMEASSRGKGIVRWD